MRTASILAFVGLLCALVLSPRLATAGDAPMTDLPSDRHTTPAMGVLLGWSALNMTTGAIGRARHDGRKGYYHEMNLAWNVVNAAIGAAGLLQARRQEAPSDPQSALRSSHGREKLFLVNLGLNVAYVATGFALRERGQRLDDERLQGYGPSLMLQGAFLFGFDATLYVLQRRHTRTIDEPIPPSEPDDD